MVFSYRRWSVALLLAALLPLLCFAGAEGAAEYDMNAPENLLPEHLYAESALLVDQATGQTLFSKNARVRMYPASTTKIMTLLLALESDIALDATVVIPEEAAQVPEGSSVIPVQPGDEMSYRDLLYGFMLSSGNDGANAIAVLTYGGIEPFVARMNERAASIGCEGTHYVNAHGYHDREHYTTAQDLARISIEAMQNEDFRKIVAAPKWTMTIKRGGETVATEIISRNSLLQSDMKYYYPACTGIKTGHHNKAGWCIVGSAERDGMRVICVVLNCEQENDKWYDAARLFEYGFTRYRDVPLRDLLDGVRGRFARVTIEGADPGDPSGGSLELDIGQLEGGEQSIKVVADSEKSMEWAESLVADSADVEWLRELRAPIAAGEALGRLTLEPEPGLQATAVLTASRDVAAQVEATATIAAPTDAPAAPQAATPPRASGGSAGLFAVVITALLAALGVAIALAAAERRRRRARRRRRRRAL